MSILQSLEKIDKDLFVLINHDLGFHFLDPVMLFLRNPYTWIPLYAFILIWIIRKLKKKTWLFVIFSLATFAVTDSVAGSLLKPLIGRLRPCFEPGLAGIVRVLDGCGGRYSFPSNHAANHFGLATFWFASIWMMTGRKWYWLWVWAFLICYAQVYVGKHYPGDVLGGAIFGMIVGLFMYRVFSWFLHKTQKNPDLRLTQKHNPGSELL